MAAAVTFRRLLLGRSGAAALSLRRVVRGFGVRTAPTGEKVTHTGQVSVGALERAPRNPGPRPGIQGPRRLPCPSLLPAACTDQLSGSGVPRTPGSPLPRAAPQLLSSSCTTCSAGPAFGTAGSCEVPEVAVGTGTPGRGWAVPVGVGAASFPGRVSGIRRL